MILKLIFQKMPNFFYQSVKSFDFLVACSVFNSLSVGNKNMKKWPSVH